MNGYKIVLLKAILCFIGCRKVNGYAPEYVFDDTEFIQCMKDYFDNINYHSLMNNGTNNNLK